MELYLLYTVLRLRGKFDDNSAIGSVRKSMAFMTLLILLLHPKSTAIFFWGKYRPYLDTSNI